MGITKSKLSKTDFGKLLLCTGIEKVLTLESDTKFVLKAFYSTKINSYRVVETYKRKYGLDTVSALINVYRVSLRRKTNNI